MSWQAAVYVRDLRGLSSTEKLVALCLALRLEPERGEAWPSLAALAEDASLTKRAVRLTIRALEKRGVLSTETRRDPAGDPTSSTYRFPLMGVGNHVPHLGNDVPHVGNDVPHGGEPRSAGVGNDVPPKRHIEKTIEKTDDPEIHAVFAYYCQHIQPQARETPGARQKIRARLKVLSADDLRAGIDHFAADAWSMEHNSHRGAEWFFHSDARAEQYLLLKPRAAAASRPANGRLGKQAYNPADLKQQLLAKGLIRADPEVSNGT